MDDTKQSIPDESYSAPAHVHAPRSPLEFLEALAPVVKYYVVLLFFYYIARRVNKAMENEAKASERDKKRPELSKELMETSSEEDDSEEEEEDEEIYEELVTEGSRLVKMPASADATAKSTTTKKKQTSKPTTKGAADAAVSSGGKTKREHPLFEGLKKVEEELREKKESGEEDEDVSWNELHMAMLKRYQEKYPEHGPRVQHGDDYDDEFKDLLKKHNIDPEQLKKEQ